MLFNIYVANHGKRDGVEDFICILQNTIEKRGHQVVVSEILNSKAINILIDEFTNAYINFVIADFKDENPNAILIYVLTEFFEKKWLVKSFNFFGGILEASVIAILSIYIRLRRDDFRKPLLRDWILGVIYFPLIPIFLFSQLKKILISRKELLLRTRVHALAYMLMRYMGLEKMLNYADGVVMSHSSIIKPSSKIPVFGVIYPEFDLNEIKKTIFHNKSLGIEVTGTVTTHRHNVINKINNDISILGLKGYFKVCRTISFSSLQKNEGRAAYSIHPPQTREWKYSSPTRIFRALQYDHNMPVLTKVFNQHPIEKLCIEFKGDCTLIEMVRYYDRRDLLLNFLGARVEEYNLIASKENDALIDAILDLAQKRITK